MALSLADIWNRAYALEHRRFTTETADGVPIAGVHLDRSDTDLLVIYAHGFLSNKNHRVVPHFVELLSERFDVMAFDFRGHGESGGACSFGNDELLDLDAVVRYARGFGYQKIVTVGSSMGGATVIRHAGLVGNVDGVATIGAFADARNLRRPTSAFGLHLIFNTALGGPFAAITRGTRVGDLEPGEHQPIDVVDRIAPAPLLLIHGEWDMLIHPDEAESLFARAREPKELVVVPRGGHDIPLLTSDTIALLDNWIKRKVIA
ncbi:MAG: alpha/beta fold hydrolase [Ardenticatenaceae bacterium]|nr:alpha/beta fold hydrolase [Ardenticatenaceae bacterium]